MHIVLVYWNIRPDKREDFLKWWWETTKPPNRPKGLIMEMLSEQVEDKDNTWKEVFSSMEATTYFTVGLWEDKSYFRSALSKFMTELYPFEASMKKRVWLEPRQTH